LKILAIPVCPLPRPPAQIQRLDAHEVVLLHATRAAVPAMRACASVSRAETPGQDGRVVRDLLEAGTRGEHREPALSARLEEQGRMRTSRSSGAPALTSLRPTMIS
jgi:hypothetical protein